jgi:hypothetical protein
MVLRYYKVPFVEEIAVPDTNIAVRIDKSLLISTGKIGPV